MKLLGKLSMLLLLLAGGIVFYSCNDDDDPPPSYTIGGTVSGMSESGSVTLVNGTDEITVSENGPFTFPTAVANGGSYEVTVQTNPDGQTASVENGKGTVSGANVTNVTVTCSNIPLETYLVGGTVSGLSGTLVLVNGTDEVTVTEDGPYVFPTPLPDGTRYDVKVKSEPANQQSVVQNGNGTIDGADVTNANVELSSLAENSFKIGGNVTGMAGGTLVLANGSDEIEITSDGPFTFPTAVENGNTYNVTIKSQPSGGFCTVMNGSGTVNGANITDVSVTCEAKPTYTVGGNVANLMGTLVITNNEVDELQITQNGPFTFTTPIADGSNYRVAIKTQPADQICTVVNPSGTINGANVTNVEINCESNPDIGTNYFTVDNRDPAIFYEFQSDKTLSAKSTNGMAEFENVVGLAYDSDNDILYGYATVPNALISINRTTGVASKIANVNKLIYDLAYDKNADVLYSTTTTGELVSINVTNGDLTVIENSLSLVGVVGLTYDPNNDILYGARAKDFGGGTLVTIDVVTAEATAVGEYENEFFPGLAYDTDNNKLYGLSGFNATDLFEISTADGSLTKLGVSGVPGGDPIGMAYVDSDDQLLATWGAGSGKLFEVNKANGGTVSIASSGYPFITDLAYRNIDDQVYGLVGEEEIALLVAYNEANGTTTFKSEVAIAADQFIKTGFTHEVTTDRFYYVVGADFDFLAWQNIDGSEGQQYTSQPFPDNEVLGLAFDNANDILYGINEFRVFQLDEDTGAIVDGTTVDLQQVVGPVLALNFDPNRNVLVATFELGEVYAINPATGEMSLIVDTNQILTGITYKGQ